MRSFSTTLLYLKGWETLTAESNKFFCVFFSFFAPLFLSFLEMFSFAILVDTFSFNLLWFIACSLFVYSRIISSSFSSQRLQHLKYVSHFVSSIFSFFINASSCHFFFFCLSFIYSVFLLFILSFLYEIFSIFLSFSFPLLSSIGSEAL